MKGFALIDCNNFYVSCERAFNARLEGQPVVVLSNNDGCVIARSEQAKAFGVAMGVPFFNIRQQCREQGITVLSSNYTLYGDLSARVMAILSAFEPRIEVYSIDEAFLCIDDMQAAALPQQLAELRAAILRQTGIPVSIGVGATKTLAKMANHHAKKQAAGVCLLIEQDVCQKILTACAVEDVWGVGHRWANQLRQLGVSTAADLTQVDLSLIRAKFSVVLEKTVRELKGTPCLELDTHVSASQTITCSRSFGCPVRTQQALREALSCYAVFATRKLRRQGLLAQRVIVWVSGCAADGQQQSLSHLCCLASPSNDTRDIIKAVQANLTALFQAGVRYKKAGVLLTELLPAAQQQQDLFQKPPRSSDALMQAVDAVQARWGKDSVYFAAQNHPNKRRWVMASAFRSMRYTTSWGELLVVS